MSESQSAPTTTRLEAFSDGVFAIALTLLVLDLRVPRLAEAALHGTTPAKALLGALGDLWPNFLAYFTSFAVVLSLWASHHRVFTMVTRTNQAFLFWNGLLLMFVTLVPFPTALIAEYMAHYDPGQFRIAAIVYAANGFFISGSFHCMWRHAIRDGRLLPPGTDMAAIKKVDEEYRWAPAAYLALTLLAFVLPWVSMGLCLTLVVAFSIQGFMNKRPLRRRSRTAAGR